MEKESKIYTLSNPINNEIFYVGHTTLELSDRLKGHYCKVNEATRGGINWNKRLIYLDNLKPHKAIIAEIDRIDDLKEAQKLEKYYIDKYSKNHPLTNQTIGGVGGDTYSMLSKNAQIKTSDLISKQLKGKKKPEGFGKKLSIQRSGYGSYNSGKTIHPPIVLESSSQILVFKNRIETNSYFENKHTWGNLVACCKHNIIFENKWYYLKTYNVNFKDNCNNDIKDIVQSLLEKEGNCYVYDKHTQKITIK